MSQIDLDNAYFDGQYHVLRELASDLIVELNRVQSDLFLLRACIDDSCLTPLEAAHAGSALDEVRREQ